MEKTRQIDLVLHYLAYDCCNLTNFPSEKKNFDKMSPALLQGGGGPKSAEEMDEERKEQIVYEYLCRLEEAKKWIEHLLKEELPEVTIFEQNLRNGVVLAKLASYFAPTVVNSRKIFDIEEHRFEQQGLHFRHTDNINYFLKAISSIGNVQL